MKAHLARITRAAPRAVRRAAAKRLEAALPDLSTAARHRLLSRSFSHQARVADERRALDRVDPVRLCSRLEFEGWERIEQAQRTGGGVVLLSASLGLFELVSTVLDLYKGGSDTPHDLTRLDQPQSGHAADHSIELPFLGRPFKASTLAAARALDQAYAALPVFAFLERRRRFRVVVRPPIVPIFGGDDKESLTRRFVVAIEAEILARPEQYPWSTLGLAKARQR
ncbi:MAG: hypothetical protein OES47_00095 [Acidobacteriota bacterium]|nr:hypothetical protein [Acidobacteriota bacterium]